MSKTTTDKPETLRALPGDDVRQIMWRFAERYDLQMVIQSAREVARGPVARLVAEGARNDHDWTPKKAELLKAYDDAGITSMFMDPEHGGFLEGPKNLAMALAAFELAWVDAGAATCSLAGNLALAPIHERGTPEQRNEYMTKSIPPQPGEDREIWRGAFALTEPLPYVGVETGLLGGKARIADWNEGGEPVLQIDKRGRFITNMSFANFVTAAVESDDEKIKGSFMVILHEDDEGSYDPGVPALKLVHQLSSTTDPIFSQKVPANRIIGGYTMVDGIIVPNYTHSEIIEAVFKRTRVTVGLMTSAKLLSSVEPIIRYQRGRFRGGDAAKPGSVRYDLGLQQKEDVVQRLVDIWATGEAASSLGFETARLFDDIDPLEKAKETYFEEQGIKKGRAQFKALRAVQKKAIELVELEQQPEEERDAARLLELRAEPLIPYVIQDALGNVLCPACKLWNTGHGANVMREAVSLMGGYGITEDCPGFLGHKWMDAQLEATYEGPESVQRRQMSVTMVDELFLKQFEGWITEMRRVAADVPETGACTVATAMEMWLWTLRHLQSTKDANGAKLYGGNRQGVTFPMADALCWLLASRCQILDILELREKGPQNPALAEGLEGLVNFMTDLAHTQAARAAGETGRICAELAYGFQTRQWDSGCCETSAMETGSCAVIEDLQPLHALRTKLDSCLAGARLAKDRAANALTGVMIPEALDYPR